MDLSDAEMLKYLSAGKVSRGLYFQQGSNENLTLRNVLIELPDDVQFTLPSLPETAETFEFSNHEISERFMRVLNNGGKNLAEAFFSKISLALSRKKKDIEKLNSSKDPYFKKNYHKEVIKTVFVPIASVRIESSGRCKLSESALHKLKKLESCLQNNGVSHDFLNQSKEFFMEFGSHYYIGTYHFGGRRKDILTTQIKETKEKNKEKFYDSSIINHYDKLGGSPSDDDICNWKRSLVENPSKWCIIDKDESSLMNYRAVWKLFDGVHFINHFYFSEAFEEAWKTLSGLCFDTETDGSDFFLQSEIEDTEKKVDKDIFLWNCTDILSDNTGGKTTFTVSDMIRQFKKKEASKTSIPGNVRKENEIPSYKTEEDPEKITSELFEEYLTDVAKTCDIKDSISTLLDRKNITVFNMTSEQVVSCHNYDLQRNLSSSSLSSKCLIDSLDDKEQKASEMISPEHLEKYSTDVAKTGMDIVDALSDKENLTSINMKQEISGQNYDLQRDLSSVASSCSSSGTLNSSSEDEEIEDPEMIYSDHLEHLEEYSTDVAKTGDVKDIIDALSDKENLTSINMKQEVSGQNYDLQRDLSSSSSSCSSSGTLNSSSEDEEIEDPEIISSEHLEHLAEVAKTANENDGINTLFDRGSLTPIKLTSKQVDDESESSGEDFNQDELATTLYECHPNCKDCTKCKWCPICCMVEST